MGKISTTFFYVGKDLIARFATHGPDHLCIIFYRETKRVGSFCSERNGLCDYFSESRNKSEFVATFEQAVALAEKEP